MGHSTIVWSAVSVWTVCPRPPMQPGSTQTAAILITSRFTYLECENSLISICFSSCFDGIHVTRLLDQPLNESSWYLCLVRWLLFAAYRWHHGETTCERCFCPAQITDGKTRRPPVDFVLNWTSAGLNDFPKGRRKYQAQTTSGFWEPSLLTEHL